MQSPEGTASSRRDFLQGSLAMAGAMLACSVADAGAASSETEPSKRPNLVFIYTEGQRADALSLAGHRLLKTPQQDRIGLEGARFTNAFCTNALCAPARATALTGLYSKTSGALDNKTVHTPLPADIPLFTDLLHEAGYETAILGKAHLCNGARERYWDYYFCFNAAVTNYYKPTFAEGRKGVVGPETQYHGYADDLVTDKALAWLAEPREKPFCLLLWYQTPHAPFFRARRHLDMYNGVAIPKPRTFDDDRKGYPGKPKPFVDALNKIGTIDTSDAVRSLEELCKDYYAGLVAVDENIGRVFRHLEGAGVLDDTAILHSSDHGYLLGEWRLFDKRLMHEPSIRVPMMLRYPPRVKGGTVREQMVLDIDIAPTMLDLARVPIPPQMQGKSVLPLIAAADAPGRSEWFYDYYEYPGYENVKPHRGLRTRRYKLIHWYTPPQEFELYDLQNDPGENNNLYNDPAHADLQEQLLAQLEALRAGIKERGDSAAAPNSRG